MAPSRFVHPNEDTITLDNGDTLTVRRRLNVGEQRASFRACYDVVEQNGSGPTLVWDPTKLGAAKVAAFLIDWQLAEAPAIRGLDLLQRIAVIENLDPSDFFEIKDAIDAHEAKQIAARLEEKKRAPTTNGDPISNSRSAAAGASSGSASSISTTTPSSSS